MAVLKHLCTFLRDMGVVGIVCLAALMIVFFTALEKADGAIVSLMGMSLVWGVIRLPMVFIKKGVLAWKGDDGGFLVPAALRIWQVIGTGLVCLIMYLLFIR